MEQINFANDPDYLNGTSNMRRNIPDSHYPRIFGAEYDFFIGSVLDYLMDHIVPCAQCYVPTRTAMIMIPAKTQCPSGWTREYYGYLTSDREIHKRSSFNCVDVNSEGVGSTGDENGALFTYVVSVPVMVLTVLLTKMTEQ